MVLYQCEVCDIKYSDYDEAYECCQETIEVELVDEFMDKWGIEE